jgi:hypothetical protein
MKRRVVLALAMVVAAGAVFSLGAPCLRAQENADAAKAAKKPKVATVEVTPGDGTAVAGEQMQFKAVGKDAAGKTLDDKVTVWFAAPFDQAGVDLDGKATFYMPGVVRIGAMINGKVGRATITVKPPRVAHVEIQQFSAPLVVGGSAQAVAAASNANGDPRADVSFTWQSSDRAVATVDAAGVVTGLKPGRANISAQVEDATGTVAVEVVSNPVRRLAVEPAIAEARTGDVVYFKVQAKDAKGGAVANPSVRWALSGNGAAIWPDGGFVAERPGTYAITAASGDRVATASVVVKPRNVERELEVVGRIIPKDTQTTEEWIFGTYAYVASLADQVWIYDITDPAKPQLTDTLKVDARLVNDISVNADGRIGVLTREGASTRKNGIVFLDTADPLHPKVLSEYTATVTGGVHSAFINTHYVYLTDDATGSLRVIDFQDPKNPKEVARWQTEVPLAHTIETPFGVESAGRYLHDDYVRDGLAYLAYWRDGLVILDVGDGRKGGSPEHPQLVSQLRFNYNELYGPGWLAGAHAVFRYKNYVFVGDEVFPGEFDIASKNRIPVRGIMHVVDVTDMAHPHEVATYSVPEAGAHNIWVEDDILYMGYYNGGGRALDVSGELRGELYRQGREVARIWTGSPEGYRPNIPFCWGAQPYKGMVFYNDVHTGLWITKLGKPKYKGSTTEAPL